MLLDLAENQRGQIVVLIGRDLGRTLFALSSQQIIS
jgi:hypothetical protein